MGWTDQFEADDEFVAENEFEADDESDANEDEDEPLLNCPSCKREVHEDTQQCPYCGDWITPVDLSDVRKRRIWLVAVIFIIAAMTGFLVFARRLL